MICILSNKIPLWRGEENLFNTFVTRCKTFFYGVSIRTFVICTTITFTVIMIALARFCYINNWRNTFYRCSRRFFSSFNCCFSSRSCCFLSCRNDWNVFWGKVFCNCSGICRRYFTIIVIIGIRIFCNSYWITANCCFS